jgi:hypothetical protein
LTPCLRKLRKSIVDSGPVSTLRALAAGLQSPAIPGYRENRHVNLARIGWLATVLACLIAVLILALQGYYGYAGVTLAVAISAAINLT